MDLKVKTKIIEVSDGRLDHPENQGVVWLEESSQISICFLWIELQVIGQPIANGGQNL